MILRGSFYSQALGRQTNITLVGPDVWPQAGACKTAYVLHGMEGNQDTWADNSLLPLYAAKGNTLYVLPDGGRSFYRDMPQGPRYFTYLSQELPQMVRQRFQVSPIREDTAVLGCSMGGYGALLCALGCPERFGLCAAFAPGLPVCRRSPRPGGFPGAPLLLCRRLGPPSAGRPAPRFWRWHCFPRLDRSSCRFACRAASPALFGLRLPGSVSARSAAFCRCIAGTGVGCYCRGMGRHPRLLLF